MVGTPVAGGTGLLRVELDDQLLLNGLVDVLTKWRVEDCDREAGIAGLEPGGGLALQGVHVAAHQEVAPGGLTEDDGLPCAHPVARNVDALAVDQHVAVAYELAGPAAAGAPAGPEDDVVEAELQVAQQVLTGDATLAVGLLVHVAELLLQDPVDAARLLLLAQLGQVLGALAHAVAAVLAGWVGAAVPVGDRLGDRALERVTALALQEQLGPLAPAQAADGTGVSSHGVGSSSSSWSCSAYTRRRFLGRQPLW